jgi:A/G-specific adenine glycosylase
MSPYSIVVSEIMLQQTQVSRVIAKYASWMKRFPSFAALAKAPMKNVLPEWSGLGYNRRALYLKRIAEHVVGRGGSMPDTYEGLRALPGIGPNTAGAILAYAFDKPYPFIETNIRSAYIHFFFPDARRKISDAELMPLIEAALDRAHPREWHWALMDYGSYIKSIHPNPSRKSAHHVRQTPFKGSNRELRSRILRAIMRKPASKAAIMRLFLAHPRAHIEKNLADLAREGFSAKRGNLYRIV